MGKLFNARRELLAGQISGECSVAAMAPHQSVKDPFSPLEFIFWIGPIISTYSVKLVYNYQLNFLFPLNVFLHFWVVPCVIEVEQQLSDTAMRESVPV